MTDEPVGYTYHVSDEEMEKWAKLTDTQKLTWVEETAFFILSVQTREERIAAYRIKSGKNVRYNDRFDWPDHW